MPERIPNIDLVEAFNFLFPSSRDWYEISAELKEYEKVNGDHQAGWLMTAFDYMLNTERGGKRKNAKAFNPKMELPTSVYPIPLDQLPAAVADFWSEMATHVKAPQCLARLHHLLFELKHGNGGEHARKAASAYLELGSCDWSRLDQVDCLYWSLELSRRVGDSGDGVIAPLIQLAELSLDQEEKEPGVALFALEVLIEVDSLLDGLPALLARARMAYRDPWLVAITIEMQIAILEDTDGSRAAELHRELIRESIAFALQREGIVKMKSLEDAAKLATKYGEKVLARAATQAMQAMTVEDLDLKEISASFKIPSHMIDTQVDRVVNQPSLGEGFKLLVTQSPPTGNLERNIETMEKLSEEFPLQDIFPTTLLRNDALASYTPTHEGDVQDQKLSRVEAMSMGVGSEIVSRILLGLLNRFNPELDELADLIGGLEHVDPTSAQLLAKALLKFRAGEFEISAALAVPRIETLARARLTQLGNLQYQVQRGSKRGVYPQLGVLIHELKESLDPSWHRFLNTFLVSNFGPNFRNEFSHGYVEKVENQSCAMALLCTLYLALTPVEP